MTTAKRAAVALAIAATVTACGAGAPRLDNHAFHLRADVPSSGEGFRLALYQSVGAQVRPGHTVKVVGNGDVFTAIADEIRSAKSSVHLLSFIWQKGKASAGRAHHQVIKATTHASAGPSRSSRRRIPRACRTP